MVVLQVLLLLYYVFYFAPLYRTVVNLSCVYLCYIKKRNEMKEMYKNGFSNAVSHKACWELEISGQFQ